MQKKIIALAIAAAMAAPAMAFADATLYGQTNVSIDMVNDGATGTSTSSNQLSSNTSLLGVKGSEDLGGGNSFGFQMEGKINMDKGTALSFDRDTFITLGNAGMGTLVLGQKDTPYKSATRGLDLFGNGIADNRSNQSSGGAAYAAGNSAFGSTTLMGGGHDARLGNQIAYVSPNMSGMSVAVATVFGAETPTSGATKGSAWSLAGMYSQGPIYAALAYQTITAGSAGSGDLGAGAFGTVAANDKANAFKVGGSYSMDQFTVGAVIEQLTYTPTAGTGDTKATNLYLAGKFNVSSSDAVKLAYTKRGASTTGGVTNTDDANQVSLGYDHAMSKATSVYALYSKISQGAANSAAPTVLSAGVKHSF